MRSANPGHLEKDSAVVGGEVERAVLEDILVRRVSTLLAMKWEGGLRNFQLRESEISGGWRIDEMRTL